jgi:hypothetical protein
MGPIGPIGLIGNLHISPIGPIGPIRIPVARARLLPSVYTPRRVHLLARLPVGYRAMAEATDLKVFEAIIRVHMISGIVIRAQPGRMLRIPDQHLAERIDATVAVIRPYLTANDFSISLIRSTFGPDRPS